MLWETESVSVSVFHLFICLLLCFNFCMLRFVGGRVSKDTLYGFEKVCSTGCEGLGGNRYLRRTYRR